MRYLGSRLMIRITLSPKETRQRQHARRYQNRIAERCHSVLLSAQGLSIPQISHRLDRDQQTVRAWLKAYQRDGIDGLDHAPKSGRPPTKGQALDQHLHTVLDQSPSSFGYLEAGWTVNLIRDHLAKQQLEVSDSTVRRHLQAGGWVYKRFTQTVPQEAPTTDEKKLGWHKSSRPSPNAS
jgi:transposase